MDFFHTIKMVRSLKINKIISRVLCVTLLFLFPVLHGDGAGVVPFYIAGDGKISFLLGHDVHRPQLGFLDFGGAVDAGESSEQAAAREGHEETSGLFSGTSDDPKAKKEAGIKFFLDKFDDGLCAKRKYKGSYHVYFVDVTKEVDIFGGMPAVITKFSDLYKNLTAQGYDHHYCEKDEVTWVDADDLIKVQTGTAGSIGKDGYYDYKGKRYYRFFINTIAPALSQIISKIKAQSKRVWALGKMGSVQVSFNNGDTKQYVGELKNAAGKKIASVVCPVDPKPDAKLLTIDETYVGYVDNLKIGSEFFNTEKIHLLKSNRDASWYINILDSQISGGARGFRVWKITQEKFDECTSLYGSSLRKEDFRDLLRTYQPSHFFEKSTSTADHSPLPKDIQLAVKACIEVVWPIATGKQPALVPVIPEVPEVPKKPRCSWWQCLTSPILNRVVLPLFVLGTAVALSLIKMYWNRYV